MNETFLSIIITIYFGLILLVLFLIGIILNELIFKKKKKEELNNPTQAREIANKAMEYAKEKDDEVYERLIEQEYKERVFPVSANDIKHEIKENENI